MLVERVGGGWLQHVTCASCDEMSLTSSEKNKRSKNIFMQPHWGVVPILWWALFWLAVRHVMRLSDRAKVKCIGSKCIKVIGSKTTNLNLAVHVTFRSSELGRIFYFDKDDEIKIMPHVVFFCDVTLERHRLVIKRLSFQAWHAKERPNEAFLFEKVTLRCVAWNNALLERIVHCYIITPVHTATCMNMDCNESQNISRKYGPYKSTLLKLNKNWSTYHK